MKANLVQVVFNATQLAGVRPGDRRYTYGVPPEWTVRPLVGDLAVVRRQGQAPSPVLVVEIGSDYAGEVAPLVGLVPRAPRPREPEPGFELSHFLYLEKVGEPGSALFGPFGLSGEAEKAAEEFLQLCPGGTVRALLGRELGIRQAVQVRVELLETPGPAPAPPPPAGPAPAPEVAADGYPAVLGTDDGERRPAPAVADDKEIPF